MDESEFCEADIGLQGLIDEYNSCNVQDDDDDCIENDDEIEDECCEESEEETCAKL